MNRVLDRFCLFVLAAILFTLVAVGVAPANPDPDCVQICQQVKAGVKCTNGIPQLSAIVYEDETCWPCNPSATDIGNCRYHVVPGATRCWEFTSIPLKIYIVPLPNQCPCSAGGTDFEYAEVWDWEDLGLDTTINWKGCAIDTAP